MRAVYRKLDNGLPSHWQGLGYTIWQVEMHNTAEAPGFPLGVAWVWVHDDGSAILEYIQVADRWRRRGIGKSLIRSIRAKWPGVNLGEPISPEGECLLRSVTRPAVAA